MENGICIMMIILLFIQVHLWEKDIFTFTVMNDRYCFIIIIIIKSLIFNLYLSFFLIWISFYNTYTQTEVIKNKKVINFQFLVAFFNGDHTPDFQLSKSPSISTLALPSPNRYILTPPNISTYLSVNYLNYIKKNI